MKRVSRSQILLFVSFGAIAVVILFLSFIRESRAEIDNRLGGAQPSPVMSLVLATIKGVPNHGNYRLPYPGMLPTNSLYPVKMMRDRIGLIFTRNPDRRAKLLLHYADKRIAAAHVLIERGLIEQAVSTATKAEAYLFQAIEMSPKIDPAARTGWFDTVKQASLKHEEVIEELKAVSDGQLNHQASRLYDALGRYRELIVTLSGQPFGYTRPEDAVSGLDHSAPATPSATPASDPLKPHI